MAKLGSSSFTDFYDHFYVSNPLHNQINTCVVMLQLIFFRVSKCSETKLENLAKSIGGVRQ